ncbi:hypothetical protein BGZ67_004277 [Mortierella alpina]|nr:hypothetical protein BGZ67_004277 [Mortierella alpina]
MSPLLPAGPFLTWSTSSNSFGSPLVPGGSLGVPRITVNGTEYDGDLGQLVKKTLVGQGDGRNELAGGHDDEEEEEEYGIETMYPVSLEGLVYDDVDDVMAGCESGERVMEMALADSREIRGIDMGSWSSLIRQEDVDQPSSGCCQRNERGDNQWPAASLPVEMDTTAFHTRLQGHPPSSKKNIIGSNSSMSYVRTRPDPDRRDRGVFGSQLDLTSVLV